MLGNSPGRRIDPETTPARQLLTPPRAERGPRVMGILNVTPDSFSDGGDHETVQAAVEHGLRLWAQGADIVDVGGESTRPGAARVPPQVEMARVLPVVRELNSAGVILSIDTTRSRVAEAAIEAGALLVNDVSGGRADPRMANLVAQSGVPYVVMHWRGPSSRMRERARYRDVVQDVARELCQQIANLMAKGVRADQLIIDPGLGFAKSAADDWAILEQLEVFTRGAWPVLVGASRKSFLRDAPGLGGHKPDALDTATAAVSTWCATKGVWGLRVHSVGSTRDATAVASRLAHPRASGPSTP